MTSGPVLKADPSSIPAGGKTEISYQDGTPNKSITLTMTDALGGVETYSGTTDANGDLSFSFTPPSGWTGFSVSGGGAPTISVSIT